MTTKLLFFITGLCLNMDATAQGKLDYKVFNDTTAVIIYKLVLNSEDSSATLMATNIYCKENYYVLANKGSVVQFLEGVVIPQEPGLIDKCKKITSLINESDTATFLEYFPQSRHYVEKNKVTKQKNYRYGGDQYRKNEVANQKKGLQNFYIAFRMSADLLFIYDDKTPPFYMQSWGCPDSHELTNGKYDVSVVMLNLHRTWSLTKNEIKNLKLLRLKDFGYNYYYCD